MWLAYRGVSVIVIAPLLALLAAGFGGAPLLATYTQIFMVALGGFITKYFALFLLGALLGKLMEDSGSARAIAERLTMMLGVRHAIAAIVIACAVLTYGGVSLFVVVFVAYPLAAELFRAADVPKRLIPASIALGSFTFSMSCLPGSTQIQNLIPMTYFKTTAFAAPVLGLLGGALMLSGGLLWLNYRARRAAQAEEGYGSAATEQTETKTHRPSFVLAILPLIAVISLNYLFAEQIIPRMDTSYLSEEKYGATEIEKLRGIWATIAAMSIAVLLTIGLNWRTLSSVKQSISKAAAGCMLPIFNTASEVGYGATIASLPAFGQVKTWVLGIAPNNPLISEAVAVTGLAGITGSASGGLSIALKALGNTYYERALELGINPELMHRVAAMSAGGLDTLPHNGAVITLLVICGLTHRQSYADIGMVSLVIPLFSTATIIAVGTMTGAF